MSVRAGAVVFAKVVGILVAFAATAFALRARPRLPVADVYPARLGDRVVKTARQIGLGNTEVGRGLEVYEFADFECPACKGSQPRIRALAVSGKIALTFVPYVIASHRGSEAKALAYLAAPDAMGRERLVEPLWRSSKMPDGDPRFLASFVETGTGEKLRGRDPHIASAVEGLPEVGP